VVTKILALLGLALAVGVCLFCFGCFLTALFIAGGVCRSGRFEGIRISFGSALLDAGLFLVLGILSLWAAKKLRHKTIQDW